MSAGIIHGAQTDFNPQGPRGPRRKLGQVQALKEHFNPQGPRGPRPHLKSGWLASVISIHKALAGLDLTLFQPREAAKVISIHKALAGLDIMASPVL